MSDTSGEIDSVLLILPILNQCDVTVNRNCPNFHRQSVIIILAIVCKSNYAFDLTLVAASLARAVPGRS
eukprot:50858-Eustigmatos_ZCMA.PRE.1